LAGLALLAVLAAGTIGGLHALRALTRALPLPMPDHPTLIATPLTPHYFVNDLIGFGGDPAGLPAAFILSHSARAAAVRRGPDGDLAAVPADSFGIPQDPDVPGWGAATTLAPRRGALQLDYLQTMLVGRFDVPATQGVELTIDLPWFSRHALRGDIDVLENASTDDSTRLRLALRGSGSFQVEALPPPADGFPIQFEVTNLDPANIALGAEARAPAAANFTLRTRDFHAFALGELDGDAGAEFAVVRGGNRGRMSSGRLLMADRSPRDLLYDSDTRRELGERYPGFVKAGCPGRQSAWVDANGDGRLDLYVVCGRTEGDSARFTNQLFLADQDDFTESARAAGLAFDHAGNFRFIDWDGDLQDDMLWVDGHGDIALYRNDRGTFREIARVRGRYYLWQEPSQVLISDIDGDRAPDALIVNREGNQIVWNRPGGFELDGNATARGLPAATLAGAWIDADLDGATDFLALDGGLYRGLGDGRFAGDGGRGWLRRFLPAARLVSFDTAGERRLLYAVQPCLPGRLCSWRSEMLIAARRWPALALLQQHLGLLEPEDWETGLIQRGASPGSHREVALQLAGTPANPHAIGARIDLDESSGARRHWVGEAESAHFSQGNFAIYLSVPERAETRGEAIWADGCRAAFTLPAFATSFTVTRPADCNAAVL